MRKIFLLSNFFLLFILYNAYGQAGQWEWINGSNTSFSAGNFGVQGIPSPNNEPPALYEPCEWTDLNGNFWLFGGNSFTIAGAYSALWKYDPSTNVWTWMNGLNAVGDTGFYGIRGVSSPSNRPPSRGYAAESWVDLNGNFWMFGGLSSHGILNDLWKYNIATNEWTWMKGSRLVQQPGNYGTRGIPDTANNPPARDECATSWTDNSGNLWLFGGDDIHYSNFNDLWKYNIATNSWTWMKGSNATNQFGIYGSLGIEDSSNTPGARSVYSHWKDNNGNLWLFGGVNDSSSFVFNDLWRYNIITNNWTWMSGSSIANSSGSYDLKCNLSAGNIPGPRFENRTSWTDTDGNFWMFGGELSLISQITTWNDLWKYCVANNEWSWISGDSTLNAIGNYGTLGVPSSANQPFGRGGAVGWTDHNNHLFLFGGMSQGALVTYNDLWEYTIDTTCVKCDANIIIPSANFISSDSTICSGDCINFTNFSQHSNSYYWLFPGGNPSSDTSANPHGICYSSSGNYDVTLIATNNYGSDTLTLPNFITVYPQIPFSALTQNGDTLFSIPGYPSYEWYEGSILIPGANNFYYVATQSDNYSVVVTDINGCFASAQMLNVIASVKDIKIKENDFTFKYNNGNLFLDIISPFSGSTGIELNDVYGNLLVQKNVILENGKNEIELPEINLAFGIYFIKVSNSSIRFTKKIFIQ